jgi:FtsH-binding integral membrane protein
MPDLQSPLPRNQLISKVYQTLGYQLLCTLLCIFLTRLDTFQSVIRDEFASIYVMSFVLMLISSLSVACNLTTDLFIQKMLTCVFTVSASIIISFSTMFVEFNILLMSMVMCFVVVTSLNYYATLANFDSYAYEYLVKSLLLTYLCSLILNMWIGLVFYELILIMCGITTVSLHIVYDTRLMLYNSQYMSLGNEDYLIIAMNLYLDVVNMFLNILKLLRFIYSDRRNTNNR